MKQKRPQLGPDEQLCRLDSLKSDRRRSQKVTDSDNGGQFAEPDIGNEYSDGALRKQKSHRPIDDMLFGSEVSLGSAGDQAIDDMLLKSSKGGRELADPFDDRDS